MSVQSSTAPPSRRSAAVGASRAKQSPRSGEREVVRRCPARCGRRVRIRHPRAHPLECPRRVRRAPHQRPRRARGSRSSNEHHARGGSASARTRGSTTSSPAALSPPKAPIRSTTTGATPPASASPSASTPSVYDFPAPRFPTTTPACGRSKSTPTGAPGYRPLRGTAPESATGGASPTRFVRWGAPSTSIARDAPLSTEERSHEGLSRRARPTRPMLDPASLGHPLADRLDLDHFVGDERAIEDCPSASSSRSSSASPRSACFSAWSLG